MARSGKKSTLAFVPTELYGGDSIYTPLAQAMKLRYLVTGGAPIAHSATSQTTVCRPEWVWAY